jgi:hypothetical protein
MNDYEIQRRLRKIREVADDYEDAHCLEDELLADVMRAVSQGDYRVPWQDGDSVEYSLQAEIDHIQALCRAALESLDIDFPRHCA